jgi:WXG100 family type VII secretion target
MSVSKVRADYEQLAQIAQVFGQQAEAAQHMLAALQQDMSILQGGDWVGKGADQLYAEMKSAVLPSLGRLVAAMDQAASMTAKISQIMKQAEDDSAALFRLDGPGAASRARRPAGASAFNFDWQDVVNQEGERYTPPPHGPTPLPDPGGRVITIQHGNRRTPEQIKEWRQQHPTAPVQKIGRTDSRQPKFSEEQLKKEGYYKARTDFDDAKKVKTEIWLKDKKQDLANGKGEELQIRRSWDGNSIFRRVPPGPGFYKDGPDFGVNWIGQRGGILREDRLGNKPDQPITVDQLWANGYFYAASAEIPDRFNPGQKIFREFWANDHDGTFIQIDRPLP